MARRALSPAALAVVQAVRAGLGGEPTRVQRVRVACSGGADSLALAAGLAWLDSHEPDPLRQSSAMVVDHGLQAGSAEVALGVVESLRKLGLPAEVVRVIVDATSPDGVESAARDARYAALARGDVDVVLLGHTMDDQAETVLLGLARGSGTRSLAGMPASWVTPHDGSGVEFVPNGQNCDKVASPDRVETPGCDAENGVEFVPFGQNGGGIQWGRPLIGLRRATTQQACADWNLQAWNDPMNDDTHFSRVRARRLLPILERELGPGIVESLSRTAALTRDDADFLDWYSNRRLQMIDVSDGLAVEGVANEKPAIRGRMVRAWLQAQGVEWLSFERTGAVLALVEDWRGQAGAELPGGRRVVRRGGRLVLQS